MIAVICAACININKVSRVKYWGHWPPWFLHLCIRLVCLSGLSACLVCLSGLSVCLVCLSGLYVWSVCLVCLSVCGGLNFIFALSAVCTNQVLICCLNIEFLYNVFILCALLYLNGSLFYSLVAWAPWYLCLVHLQGFIQRGGHPGIPSHLLAR